MDFSIDEVEFRLVFDWQEKMEYIQTKAAVTATPTPSSQTLSRKPNQSRRRHFPFLSTRTNSVSETGSKIAKTDKAVAVLMTLFHFLFLFLHFCSQPQLAFPSSVVKYLPGFEGPLPFELETGYVGVDEEEAVQLFYYFIKSERNPQKDPLLLWLTGGPACSSLSGMFFEIGPLRYKVEMYNGSLPTLVLNPHSWTKVSSIIFLDSPVGSGFSYARNNAASQTGDWKQVHQILQFLRKWLIDHPGFLSSPLYIGGDSYSGITVPAIVQELSYGNEAGILPSINLQGYVLGNPRTVPTLEANMQIPFAHGMGLISDELYESLQRNCKGEYQNVDSRNTGCLRDIQYYFECIAGIEGSNILEPHCSFASPKPVAISDRGRSLAQRYQRQLNPLPETSCRTYGYLLSKYWANDQNVRKALGIREGTVGEWQRCIDIDVLPYKVGILDSFQFHVNLSSRDYRSLVYSGDHDMLVPFPGTQAWIRLLNNSITDDWRPWMLQGQVAGYTRSYSNRMTFATVKGGCHTAPETKPAECFAMFKRWSSQASL